MHENSILNSLPIEDFARIAPHLQTVCLPIGKELYRYGDLIEYVYFPLDAVIHSFLTMKNGTTLEAGIIGSEGVANFAVFMGATTVAGEAIVLNAARALKVRTGIIRQEFNKGGHFQQSVLRFINSFCVQLSHTAICNYSHRLGNRMPRYLLSLHDRFKTDSLTLTQEFIGQMLGTNRPYVTTALGILQEKQIIKCRRSNIEILDRRGLENQSCECYKVVRRQLDLLHDTPLYPNTLKQSCASEYNYTATNEKSKSNLVVA